MKRFIAALVALGFVTGPLRSDQRLSKPTTVPFDLLATKHIVVKVRINGKGPYPMIFDTGAPVSILNTRTAQAAGVIAANTPRPVFNLFGPTMQTNIKRLSLGGLEAESVPVIVMDHPTVEVVSKILGPVEGILGFPFFARYAVTLDYQAQQITFLPNGYQPVDVLQALMVTLMNRDKPITKVLAPMGLWGMVATKEKADETAGVTVRDVLPDSAAAKAGLRAGDRLLTLDDRWTDTVIDCYLAASHVKPGTEVFLQIERQGKTLQLRATPQPGL